MLICDTVDKRAENLIAIGGYDGGVVQSSKTLVVLAALLAVMFAGHIGYGGHKVGYAGYGLGYGHSVGRSFSYGSKTSHGHGYGVGYGKIDGYGHGLSYGVGHYG
ncbi:keratin-associated protein 19-2-like [Varroa jacobsoni]|uniref:keratin-associated protein 19-2-like n=1 Tax=Varroa jacobsoni TaxID=62625 RepID=UPI000BF419D1|nr:keratin-associated protein 19-2-like [Varroa jacobsoni]